MENVFMQYSFSCFHSEKRKQWHIIQSLFVGLASCLESRKSNICTDSQSCRIARLMNANSMFLVSLLPTVIPLSGTEHTHLNRFRAERILHSAHLFSTWTVLPQVAPEDGLHLDMFMYTYRAYESYDVKLLTDTVWILSLPNISIYTYMGKHDVFYYH